MNHETARELLPWLLNGTLEPEERNDLRTHLEDCADCRRELEETRRAMEVFEQHVPAADLVAHAEGRETELPQEVVDAHLESCPECAEELTLLVGSLHTYAQPREAPVAPAPRRTVPAVWRQAALAAALVGLLAITGWIATWQSLDTPGTQMADGTPGRDFVINAPAVELYPGGDLVVRGRESGEPVAEDEPVLLSLNSEFSAEDAPFTVELTDAEGNVLERQENEPYPQLGVFTVTRVADHAGPLEIRIESANGAVETYHYEGAGSSGP